MSRSPRNLAAYETRRGWLEHSIRLDSHSPTDANVSFAICFVPLSITSHSIIAVE